ncbi:integrase core domain-containing protein, partial [Candidatus Woesebacteria bacterium]|nr:integrase core domain-containing protein [Candidatus Woesebacteria bacterium]
NEKHMQQQLEEYIDFYNFSRPHLALNCRTPSQMLPSS